MPITNNSSVSDLRDVIGITGSVSEIISALEDACCGFNSRVERICVAYWYSYIVPGLDVCVGMSV